MTKGGGWRYAPQLMLGVGLTKTPLDNSHFHQPARTIKNIPLKVIASNRDSVHISAFVSNEF